MDKVEFNKFISDIGTCEDETQRRELLSQLKEGYEPNFDKMAELEQEKEKLTIDNESLRSANMKLFLRVGEHKEKDTGLDPEPNKREFKDLFNEKGELK